MAETEKDTNKYPEISKNLHKFWEIFGVKEYSYYVGWMFCYMLLTLGLLGLLISQAGENRYLKRGMSMCINIYLCLFVALHWKHRATCTDKDPCKVDEFTWIKYENNNFNFCFSVAGLIAFVLKFPGFVDIVVTAVKIASAHVGILDFAAINSLFGDIEFTDGGVEEMLYSHLKPICASAVVCGFLRVPKFVCMMQCIHAYKVFFSDLCNAVLIWFGDGVFFWILAQFQQSLGYGNFWNSCCTAYNDFKTRSKTIGGPTTTVGSTSGTACIIADEHNVKTCADIAETKSTVKFLKWRFYKGLLAHFVLHCTVNGKQPTEKDIEEALNAKNFLSDEKGKTKFVIKELERLGLLDPKPKKKK